MSAFAESGHLTHWKSSEMKGSFRPRAAGHRNAADIPYPTLPTDYVKFRSPLIVEDDIQSKLDLAC
jgi:hypothetical protein